MMGNTYQQIIKKSEKEYYRQVDLKAANLKIFDTISKFCYI